MDPNHLHFPKRNTQAALADAGIAIDSKRFPENGPFQIMTRKEAKMLKKTNQGVNHHFLYFGRRKSAMLNSCQSRISGKSHGFE
jgi:hypothetical protein